MSDERHRAQMDIREKIVMALGQASVIEPGNHDAARPIADNLERAMQDWLDDYLRYRDAPTVKDWGNANQVGVESRGWQSREAKFQELSDKIGRDPEVNERPLNTDELHARDIHGSCTECDKKITLALNNSTRWIPGVEITLLDAGSGGATFSYKVVGGSSDREAEMFRKGWEAGATVAQESPTMPYEEMPVDLFTIEGNDTAGTVMVELRPVTLQVFCNGVEVGMIGRTKPELGLSPWRYPMGMMVNARVTDHLQDVVAGIVKEKFSKHGPVIEVCMRLPDGWTEPTDAV